MKFGLKLTRDNQLFLIDMETAETLAEGLCEVQTYLEAFEGNYTLIIIE